jgi:hypothetical protein
MNYLDKPPGTDVTEDTIFSSKMEVEKFLHTIYQYGIHSNLAYSAQVENRWKDAHGYANPSETLTSGASDESETCATWYETQKWNSGSIGPDNTNDPRFDHRFKAIRMVTVMLDRVDDVPNMTQQEKNQLKAEVKFIRALNYFEMLKFYGGMPIIDHRIGLDENLMLPRRSVKDMVEFILTDLDEALPDLPLKQVGSFAGRVHQGAVLALKSKLLLYAASPIFNTGSPYLNFGEHNDLICLGDYKTERWDDAAKAAKAALDWAATAGYGLITDQGVDKNYKYAWEIYDNKEIIFAEKSQPALGQWTWPWGVFSPVKPPNKGQAGITPTLNFVSKYETRSGNIQTWAPVEAKGYDVQEKMQELDYRFRQSICYNMSRWDSSNPQVELFLESKDYENKHVATCYGGTWLRKFYPERLSGAVYEMIPNSTLFQVNELYLNYAEAMNEIYGPDDAHGYGLTARQAINIIRARSGQPQILTGNGPYSDFQALVRNERAIELAFDNHRFWDIRRWLIAEQDGVMKGEMIGMKISMINPDDPSSISIDSGFQYEPYVIERRTFTKKMYLHPFSTKEVNIGYLVQNPGY